jgi:hypothetical protein
MNSLYDSAHLLNAGWRLVGIKRDTIGFGISSNGLMKMNLGGIIAMKGVVCSSNYDPIREASSFV